MQTVAQPPKTVPDGKVTPKVEAPKEAPKQEAPKAEELLKRMSAEKPPEKPAEKPAEDMAINLDDIKDPVLKKSLEEKKVNLEKHYNKKYMELAEKIKQTEQERQAMNTWTPEKIDQLTKDRNFIEAAQSIIQKQASLQAPSNFPGSQEDWSALSDSEKQRFGLLESKVNNLLTQQEQLLRLQDDERIKNRIPDYNPSEVDKFHQDITGGRVTGAQLRELMWKAINYDKSVERSYQFGVQDRQGDIEAKRLASTTQLGTASTQMGEEAPTKGEKEAPQAFFARLGRWNLDRSKNNQKK